MAKYTKSRRSRAAKLGWKRHKARERRAFKQRSEAAHKGWVTRRLRAQAAKDLGFVPEREVKGKFVEQDYDDEWGLGEEDLYG